MAKFCTNCGKEVKDNDTVCGSCGAAVGEEKKVAETKEKVDGLSIAGFVCGIFGFLCCTYVAIVGLILSIVALTKAKANKWMPICGIIFSVLGIIVMIYNIATMANGTNDVYNKIMELFNSKS